MRNNSVFLIAGNRGTGKTDKVKQLIQSSQQIKRVIVDTFDSDIWHNMKTWNHPEWSGVRVPSMTPEKFQFWKSGLYRMYSSDTDLLMNNIQLYANNALVVFEDATKYIGSKLSKDMKNFVLDSKQKNLDIVFIFHSLSQIPSDLIRVADILTLFKTNEGIPSLTKYPFHEIPVMMKRMRESEDKHANISIRLN